MLSVKGKKATHSRTGSIASQKSSRRGSGSKAPSSHPGSKKNTPEYKTAAEDNYPTVTPTAAVRNSRPRRAAAAALYDENALMDEDTPSEPDDMQEDSGNDQDFMIMPAEVKPDIRRNPSQSQQPALSATAPIGQPMVVVQQGDMNQPLHRMDDMIKPLLPSLHTSSYLSRSLEAQHNQGIPHIKPAQITPIPATALAGGHQPIYNFGSWDQANAFASAAAANAGQVNNNSNNSLGVSQGNGSNPALLGYSSSANSSGSSSGSTYNSSQLGSGGSASLASPYSFNGSNNQGATPGSALGLDLGLPPPSPAIPIIPTPQEVQHFQDFNFPGNNNANANSNNDNGSSAASNPQQQPYRIPPYSPGQQGGYESFPSFQGPNLSHHHQLYYQQQQQQQQQQRQRSASSSNLTGSNSFPVPISATAAATSSIGNAAVPSNGTTGSQGYSNNQSSSTAAQSFLAFGTSGAYSAQFSQREPPSSASSSLNLMSTSAPAAIQSTFGNANANVNGGGNSSMHRKGAPSFVPDFWAHMSVQHQFPPSAPMHSHQNLYSHLHHRSATSKSFSSNDEFELHSNHSVTSSPISAPSMLSTSPTLTTSMNLYGMTSPASDISTLPSLSSSFSSAFSGDFLTSSNGNLTTNGVGGVQQRDTSNCPPPFKHRNSFMEPLMSLDSINTGMNTTPADLNAAMLKAADAHTDQVSPFYKSCFAEEQLS